MNESDLKWNYIQCSQRRLNGLKPASRVVEGGDKSQLTQIQEIAATNCVS